MNKALLVIDMQNICVGQNHAKIFTYDNKQLIDNINKKIDSYDKNNVVNDLFIKKYKGNAFSNLELNKILNRQKNIINA